jgi:hypothetical protein
LSAAGATPLRGASNARMRVSRRSIRAAILAAGTGEQRLDLQQPDDECSSQYVIGSRNTYSFRFYPIGVLVLAVVQHCLEASRQPLKVAVNVHAIRPHFR